MLGESWLRDMVMCVLLDFSAEFRSGKIYWKSNQSLFRNGGMHGWSDTR